MVSRMCFLMTDQPDVSHSRLLGDRMFAGVYTMPVRQPLREPASLRPRVRYPVRNAEGTRARFEHLAKQWKEETLYVSSSSAIESHPAYLTIIEMGAEAIPWILADLKSGPEHWHEALVR